MARKRRKMLKTFREARNAGPYDEFPVLPAEIDPQLHLSKNDRLQPFYLLCQKDSVIVQMTGYARVSLKDSPVLFESLKPGDFLYVPGGVPHRIEPVEPSIMYRFKARKAGLEGVAWYCEGCQSELRREIWDTATELSQAGYLRACHEFNENETWRDCSECGQSAGAIELNDYQWAAIAAELGAESR